MDDVLLDRLSLLAWFGGSQPAALWLSLLWAVNFSVAAGAASARKLILLVGAEVAMLVVVLWMHGFPGDSGSFWVVANVLTSVAAAGWVAGVLRSKAGKEVSFGARHVLRVGYPLMGLALLANLAMLILRIFAQTALLGP